MIKPPSSEKKPQSETILYVLIFALALGVRLLLLGRTPLNESEARWAVQAFELAGGHSFNAGSQPAYVILTGLLFFLLSSSNGLARFLPALTGSLLVFIPLLFRRFTIQSALLRRAGWLLALCIALDPGLTALSRQAGSPIMALSLGLLTLGLMVNRRSALAGICAGLAILTGPALLQGVLGLGLTWLVIKLLEKAGLPGLPEEGPSQTGVFNWRIFLILIGATILLAGTALLRFPQGLAALADTFSSYIQSWVSISNVPPLLLPAAILLYQPLAVLLGLITAVRAWLNPSTDDNEAWLGRFLSLWALIALALSMLLPGRQVQDVAWALPPLLGLAALELSKHLPFEEILVNLRSRHTLLTAEYHHPRAFYQGNVFLPAAAGQAALLVLFGILVWHNLLRLNVAQAPFLLYAAVLGGIFLMILIVTLLVGAGWSIDTAYRGLAWGMVLLLGAYTLIGTWRASQFPFGENRELWTTAPAPGQIQELLATLTDLSSHNKGQYQALDITIAVPSASLQWALRLFDPLQVVDQLSPTSLPSAIITSKDQLLAERAAAYRGQSLVWRLAPGWSGLLPPDLLRWITYREAPETATQMILWVRNDLFPAGALTPADETAPSENTPEKIPSDLEPSR